MDNARGVPDTDSEENNKTGHKEQPRAMPYPSSLHGTATFRHADRNHALKT